MAIPKIPFAGSSQPAFDSSMNYDELLRRTERRTALAREMITTARRVSESAIEMRERSVRAHSGLTSSRKRYDIAAQLAPPTPSDSAAVLNSWKEIASHMRRGVRTVQRYEVDFNLPVRRFPGGVGGGVTAIPQELDAWLRRGSIHKKDSDPKLRTAFILAAARNSIREGMELWLKNSELTQTHNQAMTCLTATLKSILETIDLTR